MKGKIIAFVTIAAGLTLFVVLQTTNPSTIGPVGLLAVFFLLYLILMGCMTTLLYMSSRVAHRLGRQLRTKRPPSKFSAERAWYFGSLLAFAPIMLLAMQSVGSLGAYEVALVVLFLMIGGLYISKRAPR